MEKFKNKYRIPSSRLQTWDYGSNGSYFITICTKSREHFFGEIVDGKMQLNEIGKIAEQYWMEISNHFSFIELGNFVVMPNHVHGILIIDKPNTVDGNGNTMVVVVETLHCNVSTNATNATNQGHDRHTLVRSEELSLEQWARVEKRS